jgi:hypothetical protein
MVYGADDDHYARWSLAIWIDFYRNVFYFHLLLGIQDLLCVRFHATRNDHSLDRNHLCHHRVHIFSAKCRRLSMEMDEFYGRCINIILCLPIFGVLFYVQDKDVRLIPNGILFRLHGVIQHCSWSYVRHNWICGYGKVCTQNLFDSQDRLITIGSCAHKHHRCPPSPLEQINVVVDINRLFNCYFHFSVTKTTSIIIICKHIISLYFKLGV